MGVNSKQLSIKSTELKLSTRSNSAHGNGMASGFFFGSLKPSHRIETNLVILLWPLLRLPDWLLLKSKIACWFLWDTSWNGVLCGLFDREWHYEPLNMSQAIDSWCGGYLFTSKLTSNSFHLQEMFSRPKVDKFPFDHIFSNEITWHESGSIQSKVIVEFHPIYFWSFQKVTESVVPFHSQFHVWIESSVFDRHTFQSCIGWLWLDEKIWISPQIRSLLHLIIPSSVEFGLFLSDLKRGNFSFHSFCASTIFPSISEMMKSI